MIKKTRQEIVRELEAVAEQMIQESFVSNGPAYYELLEKRVKLQQMLKDSTCERKNPATE
jgi:hypothetical protein